MSESFRCGYIALLGRPNVGKSSLLNRLVGQKVSIVSPKAQTTRHRLLGIKTTDDTQFIYVDTPGLHGDGKRLINTYMNRAAKAGAQDVDCALFVITARGWTDADERALQVAGASGAPVLLIVNMIDRLPARDALLPLIDRSREKYNFAEIIPASARTGDNVDAIEKAVYAHLPAQPPLFPAEQVSDRSERFLAAEFVREQLFIALGDELPYAITVEIESFEQTPKLARISAVIWVEKDGQKAIVIGKGGALLKEVGRRARLDMQNAVGCKVHLSLWVKVRAGWADDAAALRSLGYSDEN